MYEIALPKTDKPKPLPFNFHALDRQNTTAQELHTYGSTVLE